MNKYVDILQYAVQIPATRGTQQQYINIKMRSGVIIKGDLNAPFYNM